MSDKMPDEGDSCKFAECSGHYVYKPNGECTCHLAPPCEACVTSKLVCDTCGEQADET